MQVEIDKKAQKEYLALPGNIKERIKNAMLKLKDFPDVSNIKKTKQLRSRLSKTSRRL